MTTDWAQDTFNQWLERHLALGIVASYSARMEARLREASCAPDRGALASTVAAGQAVGWLTEYRKAPTSPNPKVTDKARPPILTALTDCRQAYEARDDMIHCVS